ncbi:unnamed protein product [Phaedon cochleariae]|uniref:Glutaredoxin domain-containing protein n=1 Tax=Phaedon cochleariae TaxID=80249 RepID=A0A9N9X4K2_PHACE|nr:unnamed protein product [Phaedon cochleariae]
MEQSDLPPPVPPKTKPRPTQPQPASATVLPNGTAAVSLVDVFGSGQSTPYSDAEMIQKQSQEVTNNFFYYGGYNFGDMSSGQVSPSDTLDSGTCSDLDGTPPPASTKKKNGVSVTVIGSHKRAPSSSSGAEIDSDDNDSNSSCDSITSGKISPVNLPPQPPIFNNNKSYNNSTDGSFQGSVSNSSIKCFNSSPLNSFSKYSSDLSKSSSTNVSNNTSNTSINSPFLPATLLQDIRQRAPKSSTPLSSSLSSSLSPSLSLTPSTKVDEKSYEERQKEEEAINKRNAVLDPDLFFKFHLNEHRVDKSEVPDEVDPVDRGETFAGYRDILGDGASTIRSAKGTVRGVKNRNYKEKDAGKVVVYTTTMGVLRTTYQACMRVKQILRLLMVKFEERDVFMSSEYQGEIQERMRTEHVLVPQDAETIERLNETGELRRIMKPYKSLDVCTTCKVCGGYRLLPCQICKGSKKSVHRNHFTAEFVALKCMNCDEVGLVRCSHCS